MQRETLNVLKHVVLHNVEIDYNCIILQCGSSHQTESSYCCFFHSQSGFKCFSTGNNMDSVWQRDTWQHFKVNVLQPAILKQKRSLAAAITKPRTYWHVNKVHIHVGNTTLLIIKHYIYLLYSLPATCSSLALQRRTSCGRMFPSGRRAAARGEGVHTTSKQTERMKNHWADRSRQRIHS